MNEKKRKAEKEATKYDVDMDTTAKAQKVQHLSQMAQYLPLFTKKIRDPKAIKNQKVTKDLDYTKMNEPAKETPAEPILKKVTEELVEVKINSQERVIRDPSPRIARAAVYNEEVRKAAEAKQDIDDIQESIEQVL